MAREPPSPEAESLLREAIRLAVEAHAGQMRKDGRTPYIVHPIAVMRRLVSDLGVTDPELLATAVLHDVLEDTAETEASLRERVGADVVRRVLELTVPAEFHGPRVPDGRKTEVLVRGVRRIAWDSILVKLCDRWDNLSDIANAPWGEEKRKNYRDQTRRILEAIERRWGSDAPPNGLSEPLRRAMAEVRRFL